MWDVYNIEVVLWSSVVWNIFTHSVKFKIELRDRKSNVWNRTKRKLETAFVSLFHDFLVCNLRGSTPNSEKLMENRKMIEGKYAIQRWCSLRSNVETPNPLTHKTIHYSYLPQITHQLRCTGFLVSGRCRMQMCCFDDKIFTPAGMQVESMWYVDGHLMQRVNLNSSVSTFLFFGLSDTHEWHWCDGHTTFSASPLLCGQLCKHFRW